MTIALRTETPSAELAMPAQDQTIARLVEWAQAADAAFQMSTRLANTAFIPAKYRGKPAEMTAAILAGAELGLDPMASLRAFHDIQGTPTPTALTLRAVVQGRGHDIRIDKSDDEVAVVSGRRRGAEDWQTATWTFKRANDAGFPKKNPNWNTQRAAMLIARATSEVCRWVASDAIMGMPYSAEELQDQGRVFEPREPARRLTVADILNEAADDEPQRVYDEPVSAPATVEPFEPMADNRQRRMFALFREVGKESKEEQLRFIAETIGREVSSRKELSAVDGEKLIAALEQLPKVDRNAEEVAPSSDGES